MSAIWHDHGMPSFLGVAPRYSFFDSPEIHQEAPATYAAAMEDMRRREKLLGAVWFQRNATQARALWELKRPWWLL